MRKDSVLASLWNRLTKFSVLGIVLAIISLILGVTDWPKEGLTPYLTIFAAILFVVSVFLEGYGVYKTRNFYREDAQEVYHKMTQLTMELRNLASILHKDYDDTAQHRWRYTKDHRYKKLMSDFKQAKLKCSDYGFHKKLNNLIEFEKLMAKYRVNPDQLNFSGRPNTFKQEIENYVNTKLRSREELKSNQVNCKI